MHMRSMKHPVGALVLLCCLCVTPLSIAARPYSVTLSDAYTMREIYPEVSHVQNPGGMVCRENDILVTDTSANKIIILNFQGEYMGEAGTLGAAPLEFLEPLGITCNDEYVFVVDGANWRVQVLTHDLTFVKSVKLRRSQYSSIFRFIDIAVSDDHTIYLTTDDILPGIPAVYKIELDQTMEKAAEQVLVGSVVYHDGALYAMDMAEAVIDEGVKFGHAGLYRYQPETKDFSELFAFEDGYGPMDFMFMGEQIVCLASCVTEPSLDVFDLNGKYQHSIASFAYNSFFRVIDGDFAMTPNGDFLVSNMEEGRLFLIEKAQ